ncbi:MAG TPA: spermidine/putrescine ABC transporter substrate-binding protein [Galbitalea sp.]
MRALPEDPQVRELVRWAKARTVSRRAVLSGAAAGATVLALAACAPFRSISSRPEAAKDHSATVKSMIWANWPLYLDQDSSKHYPTLEEFERQTGIRVAYDTTVNDNTSYFSEVKARLALGKDISADTVCLTDWMVSQWIELGYTQKLDHSNIPNLSNLSSDLRKPDFDPGRNYSVPWQSGFAGLCWNKEMVPGGLKQVSDLWAPALKGKVSALSEWRDTVGLVMMEHGVDISAKTWGDKQFNAAIAELTKHIHDGQFHDIQGNSYVDDLKKGKSIAGIVWSGDVEGLNAEVGSEKFAFAIPETGGTLWSDNFLVPVGSNEKSNAEKLINFYYEPEIAAKVAAYVNYITPVEGAKEAMAKIDPTLVDDQLIFPNADTLAKVHIFRTLTQDEQTRYATTFQGMLLGA